MYNTYYIYGAPKFEGCYVAKIPSFQPSEDDFSEKLGGFLKIEKLKNTYQWGDLSQSQMV